MTGDEIIVFDTELWYDSIRHMLNESDVDLFKTHSESRQLIIDATRAVFDWSQPLTTCRINEYGLTGKETNALLITLSRVSNEVRNLANYLSPSQYRFIDAKYDEETTLLRIAFKYEGDREDEDGC